MADLDRLDIAAGIDTTPLDAGLNDAFAKIDRFGQRVAQASPPPLDLDTTRFQAKVDDAIQKIELLGKTGERPAIDLDAGPLAATLKAAGGDVASFFAGIQQQGAGVARQSLTDLIDGLAQVGVEFRATSDEGKSFQAVIEDLKVARQALDETGTLPVVPPETIDQAKQLTATLDEAAHAKTDLAAVPLAAIVPPQAIDQAKQLTASLEEAAQAKRDLAASGGGGGAPALPVDQFSAFRREATQTVVALDDVAAGMGKATAGANAYAQGLSRLEGQQRATNAEQALSARITGQFAEASRQANLGPFARGLEEIRLTGAGTRAELASGVVAFEGHARGAARATNAIAALAATSIGAEGPIARIAESALLFSGGEIAVLAVAGAVLGLGAAYQFLTTKEREAADKQEQLVQGLLREADGAIPKAVQASDALTAALERQRKAREGITARDVGNALTPIAQLIANPQAAFAAEFSRSAAEQSAESERAVARAQEDVTASVREFQSLNVQTLTQSISLHQANAEQIGRATGFVKILEQQEREVNRPLVERLAIHQQLVGLQDALNSGAREEVALRAAQAASEQSRISVLAAAPGLGTDTSASIRERAAEMARLNEIIHSGTASLAERNLAATQFNTLVAGAQVPLDRQRQQAQEIADGEASAYHDVAQAFADALGVVQAAIGSLGHDQFTDIIAKQREGLRKPDLGNVPLPDTSIPAGFERASRSVDGISAALTKAAAAGNAFFGKASQEAEDFRAANQKLADSVSEVTRGLDDVSRAASGVGIIGQQADQAISSVLGLADALGKVAESASTGNILGAIAGAVSFFGSAFSGGGQNEHDRILADNNRALAENTAAVRAGATGAGIDRVSAATAAAIAVPFTPAFGFQIPDIEGIRKAVGDAGLSIDEFAKIIKDTTGLDILDSKGRLVASTLEQANTALQKYIDQITTLSTDTASRRSQLETEDKLGIGGRSTDPRVAALEREREVQLGKANDPAGAGLHLSKADEDRIRALDLSTAEGRAAFLKEEQALAKRARDGGFKGENVGQLGSFHDVDELFQSAGTAADALNAFKDATNAASKQLQNVPDFFKLGEAEFSARSVGKPGPGDGASLPPIVLPPLDPRQFPTGPRGTDLNPSFASTRTTTTPTLTVSGPITIVVQGANKSPAEIAREVRAEFVRASLAAGLNPDAIP